jgi:hypothetical protein
VLTLLRGQKNEGIFAGKAPFEPVHQAGIDLLALLFFSKFPYRMIKSEKFGFVDDAAFNGKRISYNYGNSCAVGFPLT